MPSTPAASPFISPLSRPTSTKLRSSLVIPSIPDIVQEVIQNSLDAGSGRIDIWLDLTAGTERIRVEDDGAGISQAGMKKIGRRYGSSKKRDGETMTPLGTYGFRGEALASISALSLLEIMSKPQESEETFAKIIKNTKILFDGISTRPLPRSHGTTVVIKDIFQNIPVRQASLASTSSSAVLGSCKKVVETMALAYPSVKWGMWEEQDGFGVAPRRILQLSGGKTVVEVFKAIYGSAGVDKVQTIRVSSGTRKIEGFISLQGALTQSHQHLYINHFPIERSEISRAISKRFLASKFSMMTDDGAVDFTPGRRKSPRRVDRYPVYVLDISVPPEDIDLAYEPKKGSMAFNDEEELKAFVLAVVDEFLKRHNFVFPRIQHEEPTSPTAAIPSAASYAGDEHAVRPVTPIPKALDAETPNQFWSAKSAFWRARESIGTTPTGRSNPMNELGYLYGESPLPPPTRPESSLRKRKIGWIDDIVSEAQGHALPFTPPPLFAEDERDDVEPRGSRTCGSCSKSHQQASCSTDIKRSRVRTVVSAIAVDPATLASAEILGQVDAKFIACVLASADSSSTVILVDQHAADERIAVESILQDLCDGFLQDTVAVRYLEDPPSVILARREAEILASLEVEDTLRRWGVILGTASLDLMEDSALEYFQIPILGVPESLEFRLSKKDSHEISNLLKIHLPFLADRLSGQRALLKTAEKEDVDRERALAWMPKEMLELANSKACRNAIMFGDHLTIEQCSRLVSQLANTRHPFICAHGRPSFVPIVSIAAGSETGRRDVDWARWKAARTG